MRLYDRLLRRGSAIVRDAGIAQEEGNQLLRELSAAPLIVVDNVAKYLLSQAGWEKGELSAIPGVAPLFDTFFVEAEEPAEHWCSEHRSMQLGSWETGTVFGALYKSYDAFRSYRESNNGVFDEELALLAASAWARITCQKHINGRYPEATLDPIDTDRVVTPTRWGLHVHHYLWKPALGAIPLGPIATDWVFLQPDGRIGEAASDMPASFRVIHDFGESGERWAQPLLYRSWVLLNGIAFAHCANVGMLETEGTYGSRQERRFAERRGEPEPAKFYTLVIEPIQKKRAEIRTSAHQGKGVSLHICRGHFATYTEDRPLFGKYAGRFWIPAHVRGSADAGVVGKDYRVLAPA